MELKNICGVWYALYRPFVGTNNRCFWSDKSIDRVIAKAIFDINNHNLPV